MRRNKKAKTAVVRKRIPKRKFSGKDFSSEHYCCIRCGTPNPSPGDKCVNCGEDLFERRKDQSPFNYNQKYLIDFNPKPILSQRNKNRNNNPAW